MAAINSTATSAEIQGRDPFGDWLSGFTDGEGCFLLVWQSREHPKKPSPVGKFVIALRNDDREILEEIRAFWGCGVINRVRPKSRRAKPQVRLVVGRCDDLLNIVVPHFEKHPLRAKKRRDFQIWRQGVELLFETSRRPTTDRGVRRGFVAKWTAEERNHFDSLVVALREIRRYPGSDHPPIESRRQKTDREHGQITIDWFADEARAMAQD